MSLSLLLLVLGLACAGWGGELFLRAVVGATRVWRLSAAFVGASVAAFATSSPELAVAVGAAVAGTPEVSLGDCIGSNIVNVALILGGALILGPLRCSRESVRRDLPMTIAAPVLTALVSVDGVISRFDGVVMIGAFLGWLTVAWRGARLAVTTESVALAPSSRRVVFEGAGGLLLLVLASRLIVSGALGVAAALGWAPFVVGAVIVALGTSTPEIVTTWLARRRGEDDIGLGTILGSSVFNLLFIVAVAAILHPIRVEGMAPWAGLGFGLAIMAVAYPRRSGIISRKQGLALLGCYLLYLGGTIGLDSIGSGV